MEMEEGVAVVVNRAVNTTLITRSLVTGGSTTGLSVAGCRGST
jgi:hypothetical protein